MTDERDVEGEDNSQEPEAGRAASGPWERPPAQEPGPWEPPAAAPEPPAPPAWYGPPLPPRPDVPPYPIADESVVARPRRSPLTVLLAAIVALALLIGSGIGIGTYLTRSGRPANSTSTSVSFADRTGVVDIDTFTTRTGMHQGPDFPLGAGTGMIVTKSGQVLTNNHVIEGATRIQVTIPGGGQFVARVLGADPSDDVALLQIEGGTNFSTVTLANSESVRVSDRVVAVGNALGRGGEPAVAPGSVWGLDQSIEVRDAHGELDSLDGVIQVRAAVRPGDSGGPLENQQGDVVGMVTAADAKANGGPAEVAFAIPVNTALGIVQRIRSGDAGDPIVIGDAGYLGVRVEDLTTESGSALGLGPDQGAFISSVMPGSPAARIGMPADSVITAIDGHSVTNADSLGPLIHFHAPGQSISVTWVDSSGTHTASTALVAGPAV
jgi:S1-C subfamily serine protease